mgnify:CR=1 FL=1
MKTINLSLLLFFIFSINSYSQTISNEVLIEDSIYKFELNYNFIQKVIDSTDASLFNEENKELFKFFISEKKHQIFTGVFEKMKRGIIQTSMLKGIYDDELNSIKNDATLLNKFDDWKNQRTHTHNHPHRGENAIDCHNIDFEEGTLEHWTPSMGRVPCPAPGYQGCVQNIIAGTMGAGGTARHLLVTGGNDPDIPAVSRVGSGGYSLRLGDERNGANSDIIKHEFLVDSFNLFYTYEFAVVFQEPPGHPLLSQPFFSIAFYDSNMNLIPTCGNYFVSNASGNPGFIDVFGPGGTVTWRYKPWSKIAVDLEDYIKHKVTVVYTVADCAAGGHEARAYIDGKCERPGIVVNKTCKSIQLEADSGFLSYQWYQGKNKTIMLNDTNRILDSAAPGIYSVDLISESGCTLTLDTTITDLYITLDQEIEELEPSCNNTNDGKITVQGFGGAPSYLYSIDNGATFQASNEFPGLGIGNYTLILKDDSACQDTLNFNLLGPPPIIPNLVLDNPRCFGECNGAATASPSGGVSASGDYRVEFNGNVAVNNDIKNLCAGAYIVKVTDDDGCSQLQPFIITEPDPEVIDAVATKNENCFNDCSGTITITDVEAITYSIDNGLTFQVSNIFNNLCAEAGPYNVTIKTANGCIAKQLVQIIKPPLLEIEPIKDSFICVNKEASFKAIPSGGTPPYYATWSTGQMGFIMKESPKTSTGYTVEITDSKGCKVSEAFNINLHPQPNANFNFTPGPITDVFNTDVTFTNTTEYGAPLTYEWYISNIVTFKTRDASFQFPKKGGKTYINCLKVENEQGCRDSICKRLYIKHEKLIYVPNAFTPNTDNVNDVFIPVTEGLETKDYKFYIFNRWGELIFSTSSMDEGWNGTHKGKIVKEDSYVWRLVGVTEEDGETIEEFGHVTVLHKL